LSTCELLSTKLNCNQPESKTDFPFRFLSRTTRVLLGILLAPCDTSFKTFQTPSARDKELSKLQRPKVPAPSGRVSSPMLYACDVNVSGKEAWVSKFEKCLIT
ncbi:hypothetical protein PIB30_060478, partial [Stylosanthes scabra]|nr:hypothetical protein [Stylosanthes scabra]